MNTSYRIPATGNYPQWHDTYSQCVFRVYPAKVRTMKAMSEHDHTGPPQRGPGAPAALVSPEQERHRDHPSGPTGSRPLRVVLFCAAGVLFFAIGVTGVAWVVGGRAVSSPPESVDAVLPDDGETTAAYDPADQIPVASSLTEACEEACDHHHWAAPEDQMTVYELSDEELAELDPLGWNVPRFAGFGLTVLSAETTTAEGLRTVTVRHTDGTHDLLVSETRPDQDAEEMPSMKPALDEAAQDANVAVETFTLSTGDEASLYEDAQDGSWTVLVEGKEVEYIATSDLGIEAASRIASWMMITDHSKLQGMPDEPDGSDRISQGLEEMMFWRED